MVFPIAKSHTQCVSSVGGAGTKTAVATGWTESIPLLLRQIQVRWGEPGNKAIDENRISCELAKWRRGYEGCV